MRVPLKIADSGCQIAAWAFSSMCERATFISFLFLLWQKRLRLSKYAMCFVVKSSRLIRLASSLLAINFGRGRGYESVPAVFSSERPCKKRV